MFNNFKLVNCFNKTGYSYKFHHLLCKSKIKDIITTANT